jgi:hypothetical protein
MQVKPRIDLLRTARKALSSAAIERRERRFV